MPTPIGRYQRQALFVQQGPNTVTMNVTNTYTGPTSLLGGTLAVSVLANGGASGAIGDSSNAAATWS